MLDHRLKVFNFELYYFREIKYNNSSTFEQILKGPIGDRDIILCFVQS